MAYSSFDHQPPSDAFFGRVDTGPHANDLTVGDLQVLCVNPASLSGGTRPLLPYFGTASSRGPWASCCRSAVSTHAVGRHPGLYTAHCESVDGATWLQIDTTGIAGDKRQVVYQTLGPGWGLHLFDVNLALGNLVELVRQQTAGFQADMSCSVARPVSAR